MHQTFEGPNLVVCSFVPRPFDFYPGAIKVPYHHANVDSDEVLFYSAGNFTSRSNSGIGVGSISMHPAGFVHGPQPGSLERAIDADRTEELAVMIDTFHRLKLTETARAIAAPEYAVDVGGVDQQMNNRSPTVRCGCRRPSGWRPPRSRVRGRTL